MDYEKKYNEALERARQIKDGKDEWRYSDLIEITPALTEIFPELRESESEDERIWQWLYDIVDTGSFLIEKPCETEKILAWLEKHKEHVPENEESGTRKEQKPAWSEEDETRLTNILIMLKEYVIHHYSKDDVNKSVDWLENRFKSLSSCPSWKPSKEEMEALDVACSGKLWYGEIYLEGLKRIREQLKKL